MPETLFQRDILDTPRALAETLAGSRAPEIAADLWRGGARRFVALGSGSSYLAGAVAAYLHNSFAAPRGSAVWAMPADEFAAFPPRLDPNDAVVGVSASGEVVDVLDLFAKLKGRQRLVGITNVDGSTLTRVADETLLMRCGPSQVPTSTKTFVASVLALDLLWLRLLDAQGIDVAPLLDEIASVPRAAAAALDGSRDPADALAERLLRCRRFFVLGAGPAWPLAQEMALVLKEVAGLPAEAVQSREMIHGPSAVVDATCGVIGIAPRGRTERSTREALAHCGARGAVTASVGAAPADIVVAYGGDELIAPLVFGGPLFLLGNSLAVRSGNYSDHPAWEHEYMRAARRDADK